MSFVFREARFLNLAAYIVAMNIVTNSVWKPGCLMVDTNLTVLQFDKRMSIRCWNLISLNYSYKPKIEIESDLD